MVLLIEDPFKKVFRNSSFWSKTLLFTSGLYIFIVLVPFFIGYIVDSMRCVTILSAHSFSCLQTFGSPLLPYSSSR